jgi:hypothetical protein
MANDHDAGQTGSDAPTPRPGLKALDRLVGTWKISGGSGGETTYEWMDGGFFMTQHGVVEREGTTYTFFGILGYERNPMNPEPAAEITSRIYTSLGDTLDYTSEIDGDSLTIWFGEKGSPSVYRGRWGEDGNTLEGEWEWPGGGYKETMTRVEPQP